MNVHNSSLNPHLGLNWQSNWKLFKRNNFLGTFSVNVTSESFLHPALGGVPSPFDCYLCNRGLKTLHLRMERHFKNAMAAAKFLEADPRVERVIFPGFTFFINTLQRFI